ncbi:MAG: cyclic nucleotide-binding domain-containing protein [Gammaproteobacteria bacterium SHHR-1]|uniref:cyclic nucleotide-binding domain-containing protein n=1 Tax=Magnetovirga frankeli TaxID=947516 RepID=UPI001293748B|nr:cyclic nucleotide-binding domain-containing protein [gamma proteobacterium SS-5]
MATTADISKIEVSTGIYWVEIPQADLRLLCGCPEDSVKHLMRRGLISPRSTDGVEYESGPNAILLSDTMLQNGAFANQAEFPVLQMLYRQGMLIPGHPNNTGRKPLLIGSPQQVSAQLAYIHRGNYGLLSEAEIRATGMDAVQARELFRMKLAFSFGKLEASEELLDALILEHNDWHEIRAGVEIRRLQLSRFEIRYRDQSLEVDLNLKRFQRYWSPYPLGFHEIKRAYFSVIHSGQGDGWDVNRPSMSSVLCFQGRIYLIDTGPNVVYSLMALGIGVNEIEGIFHTHCHDDHFSGLTTLMRADHRIKHFATPLVRATLFKKLAALMGSEQEDFSAYFEPHDLIFDQWLDIDGLEVKAVLSPHPVETSILFFRTFWDGDYRTYAHLADIAGLDVMQRMINDDPSRPGISQALFDKTKAAYLEPVQLKKIDAGGGHIHGKATDFSQDRSERLILAHNYAPLTQEEKVIGSSAPFGIVDVLVPDYTDSQRHLAEGHLSHLFPELAASQFKKLLNNPIVTFKPGSLILRAGVLSNAIYLLTTGNVEVIRSDAERIIILSTGGMIGEYSGLYDKPSAETYRSISYVHALALPADSYLEFVRSNDLYAEILRLHDNRCFLKTTWLFGESIGPRLENLLARNLRDSQLARDPQTGLLTLPPERLYLIQQGRISKLLNGRPIKQLEAGDFFGEEFILQQNGRGFSYRAEGEVRLKQLPARLLSQAPVVMWKLLESHRETLASCLH